MKLKHLVWAVLAVVIGLGMFKGYRMLTAKDWSMASACRDATPTGWRAVIAAGDEPGAPLLVTGKLLESDGQTVIPGALIHMYHVDSAGLYGRSEDGELPVIRLCGIVLTDESGRYQFETIMPGAYPEQDVPSHIHYEVWRDDFEMLKMDLEFRNVFSYYEDNRGVVTSDPHNGETWDIVRPVIRDSTGLLHISRDLKRKPWWNIR